MIFTVPYIRVKKIIRNNINLKYEDAKYNETSNMDKLVLFIRNIIKAILIYISEFFTIIKIHTPTKIRGASQRIQKNILQKDLNKS